MNKKYARVVSGILCLVLLISGLVCLVRDKKNKADNMNIYEELQDSHESILGSVELSVEIPVDFTELKKINQDIYAWIDIEDTNIHYPIVQSSTDDSYYLEHTIEGKKGLPGSIYTESINLKTFQDYMTVIYGHDMKDGSMFKDLHKFSDEEFFKEHDTIMIYTENSINMYRVYAAVAYDNRHIMYSFDQNDAEERMEFIKSLREARSMRNQFRDGMEIDEDSKLVVLSTCITGQPDKRWIVVAEECQ